MREHIWANHAHVFPEGVKEGGEIRHLKELMDECSIEKAVCFTCFKKQYPDGDPVDWLYNEIKDDSSLIGFGTIDFESGNTEDQCRKILEYGFPGIKIHPAYQRINVLDDRACKVYEFAEKNGLFLSFHTGYHWYRISEYHPLLFDEVAFRYPELKFSMEHVGGFHFFRDALAVMVNSSRNSEEDTVFAGWTSVLEDDDGLPYEWSLSDDELRTIIKQTGNNRSIFGLDFPYKNADYAKKLINRIETLDIPEEAKENILGGTLRRVLGY